MLTVHAICAIHLLYFNVDVEDPDTQVEDMMILSSQQLLDHPTLHACARYQYKQMHVQDAKLTDASACQ